MNYFDIVCGMAHIYTVEDTCQLSTIFPAQFLIEQTQNYITDLNYTEHAIVMELSKSNEWDRWSEVEPQYLENYTRNEKKSIICVCVCICLPVCTKSGE